MKKADLVYAVKELNKKCGLKPPIDVKEEEAVLQEQLDEAIDLLTDSDELTKRAQKVVDELLEARDDAEDDTEEEEEEQEETLEDSIESADTLKELKVIAKENSEFKGIKLASYKKVDDLRDAMLEILDEEEEEEEEEKPKPKAKGKDKPKAAKPKAEGKSESNQELANRLLEEGATEKAIFKAFTTVYAAKDIKDADFIKKRAGIYMNIAKKASE